MDAGGGAWVVVGIYRKESREIRFVLYVCVCVCGLEGGWVDVCACVSEKVYRPSETNRMCIHVRLYNNIRCGETANFFYLRILARVIPIHRIIVGIFYSGVFVRSYFTIKPLQYNVLAYYCVRSSSCLHLRDFILYDCWTTRL